MVCIDDLYLVLLKIFVLNMIRLIRGIRMCENLFDIYFYSKFLINLMFLK